MRLFVIVVIVISSCSSVKDVRDQVANDRIEIIEYVDFHGDKAENAFGVSIIEKLYENDRISRIRYFDKAGNLVENKNSIIIQNPEWQFDYDEEGNFIRQTAIDTLGNIMNLTHWDNSAIQILEYNEDNLLVKRSFYDKEMQPVGLGDIGNSSTIFTYNENGELLKKESYDQNGRLILTGFSICEYEYNENGELIKRIYFYNEREVNQYYIYSYEEGNLQKIETFDANDQNSGYELIKFRNGRVIEIEKSYRKSGTPRIKREEILLNIDGWELEKSSISFDDFDKHGEGEYEVIINQNGRIINLIPKKFKCKDLEFNNEVYRLFHDVKLTKTENLPMKLKGELKVVIINQSSQSGVLDEIEWVLNPRPTF